MMTLTCVGRPTKDLELKKGPTGADYVNFSIAVNGGYGDNAKPTYFDCTAFDFEARRLIKAKVRKGSLLQVCGDFSTAEYDRKEGKGKGLSLRLNIHTWAYIPGASNNKEVTGENGSGDAAPNQDAPPQSDFVPVGSIDDDDLPF